jgi:hypothetical protein
MSTDNLYLTPFENAFTRLQGDQTNLKSKIISLLYLIYPTKNKGLKKFRITLILFFALVGFFRKHQVNYRPHNRKNFASRYWALEVQRHQCRVLVQAS